MTLCIFRSAWRWISLFALTVFWTGCEVAPKPIPAPGTPPLAKKMEERNNAVSLLYQLLDDEKNVSVLLIVKEDRTELHALIKDIAQAAEASQKQLQALAAADRSLNMHAIELPVGEKATRDAIATTKTKELLLSSGPDFEFDLLLSQAEALNYGWHLALIAANDSVNPEQVRELNLMGKTMELQYRKVVALMRAPAK
jgi:hypothetical protein